MIYQRGSRQSYQKWADAVGDQGYTFDNLLPFFKKSVAFTPPSSLRAVNASAEYNAAAFGSTGGPLHVSYANWAKPFSSYMEPSLNEIGIPTVQDFNSGSLLGSQYCASTVRPSDQTRESSQQSFLSAAQGRSNLKVYDLSLAKKILFDSNKKAVGVQLTSTGFSTYNLSVRKEVIISGGAFLSPQLLMVSGIGPKAQLQKYNIPVLADRPGVGQNMQDHIFFGPTWRVKVQTLTRLANDLLYTGLTFATDYTR